MSPVSRLLCIAAACLLMAQVRAQDPAPQVQGGVYLVQEGDTLASLAKQFLGDEAAAAELAAFNSLPVDAALKAGDPLVAPGPERAAAVAAIEQARQEMQKAAAAKAGEFAMEDFKRGVTLLESAGQARGAAQYARSKAVAGMAVHVFAHAAGLAGKNAQETRAAKMEAAAGKVEIRPAGGKDFAAAKAGAEIPAGAAVRTGPEGRAILSLPDGARLTLTPGALVDFATMDTDKRDGTTHTRIALQAGAMTVAVPVAKTPQSALAVTAGAVQLSGFDTEYRVSLADKGLARVVALRSVVRMESNGKASNLAAGSGAHVFPSGEAHGPVPTPGTPSWTAPAPATLTTARQVLDLGWSLDNAPKGTVAIVEIARDTTFLDLLDRKEVAGNTLKVGPLADGVYFARVTGVAGGWAAGNASAPLKLEIKSNLKVAFPADKAAILKDKRQVLGLNASQAAGAAQADTSVVAVEYSVNGGAFQRADGGVAFDKAGEFTLAARGVGADGRTGEPVKKDLLVDGTAPDVRVHIGEVMDLPGHGVVRTVSVLVDDAIQLGVVDCSLNGGPFQKYESPLKLPVTKDHRVHVRALDAFGNRAETAFTLEKITPAKPETPAPAEPPKRKGWF